jgi:DNA repair protein RadA
MSSPNDISEIDGLASKNCKQLIWGARDALNLASFKPVGELQENFDFITTGSKNFDEILGGGISTGRLTEVFGAFKSGKTNLSHTICVTTQLPKAQGGLGGSVLFIDTENTFSKAKIERIALRFGLDVNKALQNIFHARIFSTDHQLQMVRVAETAIKEKNAKLIIVDSLMALMRAEYVGIGMLASRQQVLNKLIHELSRIAETHNIAVLLTNQVMTVMKGTFSANDAIGGNIVAHGCHFRIHFKSSGFSFNQTLERVATIVDAPDLPPESAKFFITEAGISDDETIEYPAGAEIKKPKRKSGDDEELVKATEESIALVNELTEGIDVPDAEDPLKGIEAKAKPKKKK